MIRILRWAIKHKIWTWTIILGGWLIVKMMLGSVGIIDNGDTYTMALGFGFVYWVGGIAIWVCSVIIGVLNRIYKGKQHTHTHEGDS